MNIFPDYLSADLNVSEVEVVLGSNGLEPTCSTSFNTSMETSRGDSIMETGQSFEECDDGIKSPEPLATDTKTPKW